MTPKIRQQLASAKRRRQRRLDRANRPAPGQPMFAAQNIHYEIATRQRGITCGGIGVMHALAQRLGLSAAIDDRLHLPQVHHGYRESDHVLAFAYNALCGGACLEDFELLRSDEAFLDALGARRFPDPTTAGDFCRRFQEPDLQILHDIADTVRQRVWAAQPAAFFDQATIDMDGTLVPTSGQCKQGMDIAYDGTWGCHALVLTLAETGEVLRLVNRSGNRPSHAGAATQVDQVIALCQGAGFRRGRLRGDTDFSQTAHLDRWHDAGVQFLFGYAAAPGLCARADALPAHAWRPLRRPPRSPVASAPRRRPTNVKAPVVAEREFKTLRLEREDVAEFPYQPTACRREYRLVVVRKTITVTQGQQTLFPEVRYFFYLTNDGAPEREEIVLGPAGANGRCDQENLLAQLAGGVRALAAPVNTLLANGAYMLLTALAWNLKAWAALLLPAAPGRWQARRQEEKRWLQRLEFRTFVHTLMRLPCQIVRTGRRLVYRLLACPPALPILFRLLARLRC